MKKRKEDYEKGVRLEDKFETIPQEVPEIKID